MMYRNTTVTVDMCFGGQAKLESLFSPETRDYFRNRILIFGSERISHSKGWIRESGTKFSIAFRDWG